MKITESEKNKLKIEKLKEEKDNLEFEFSQNQTTFIGILAILISIFIPAILISEIKFQWILFIFLLILMFISYKIFNPKKIAKKIKEKYSQINKLYEDILK